MTLFLKGKTLNCFFIKTPQPAFFLHLHVTQAGSLPTTSFKAVRVYHSYLYFYPRLSHSLPPVSAFHEHCSWRFLSHDVHISFPKREDLFLGPVHLVLLQNNTWFNKKVKSSLRVVTDLALVFRPFRVRVIWVVTQKHRVTTQITSAMDTTCKSYIIVTSR